MDIRFQFLGSGDAFGSGGRLQTCFLLAGMSDSVLIDCGTSSLIAMKRSGVDASKIGWIILSHLHGDHFGGVPFFILDGQFNRRMRPLVTNARLACEDTDGAVKLRTRLPESSQDRVVRHGRDRRELSVGDLDLPIGRAERDTIALGKA